MRHSNDRLSMMRRHRGLLVTGVEPTLVAFAALLDAGATRDRVRRRPSPPLTSVPALRAYLARFGRARPPRRRCHAPPARGTRPDARELDAGGEDPPAARRERHHRLRAQFPLEWNDRTYRYDFAFEQERTILETNGRRWHDDPADYEHDNEKWSVPGRHGYRIVFATWEKVTREPQQLLRELAATMAA